MTLLAQFAATGGAVNNYIEDVFSTYLYTGTGASQTITNGIDLSGKGGLVWAKSRSVGNGHALYDTVRGINKALFSQATNAEYSAANLLTAFNSNGFTLGSAENSNGSGGLGVSWTFRKQEKFFDVVTYTGTGSNATISHNLGSEPGCIIVKRTDAAGTNWAVYHRGTSAGNKYLLLNSTAAEDSGFFWNPTSTTFDVSSTLGLTANGGTYICYLFAHNAGGFGLTGSDNVISCGSFTTSGSGAATVTLGYEPQWVLFKVTGGADNWIILDNMRGWSNNGSTGSAAYLYPNTAGTEGTAAFGFPTATGFQVSNQANSVGYIYIAIRRGPMKVPETGTSVFTPLAVNNATGTVNTTGFPVDLQMQFYRPGGINPGTSQWIDRLRGFSSTSTDSGTRLYTTGTDAEAATAIGTLFNNTGFSTGASWASVSMSYNNLRRAPSFFDEVCYTGTGSNMTISHNLGVAPTLMIVKGRNATGAGQWRVYDVFNGNDNYMALNTTAATASGYGAYWNTTTPTSTAFYVGSANTTSAGTYVAYLFATCAGVSKVGSYTGTGTTQTINCGFTAGARWVMIKRTDSTGDWYVWDSARGIIAGNDPYLLLNSTAAEVTGTDYVDTAATGFELSSTAPAAINANGGSFIFLAIS